MHAHVHVRRRVKGKREASCESHLLLVESYVFIWSAHWFHVTVLPAANSTQTHGLTCLFFFPFLATCFIVRLFLFLLSFTGFSVLNSFVLKSVSVCANVKTEKMKVCFELNMEGLEQHRT